jgi:hypothetical protein
MLSPSILTTIRYHVPFRGRWLQMDPLMYVGGANLYQYEFDDGHERCVIPMNPPGGDVEVELSESMTISGKCPGCGTAFSRTVRCKR